MEADRTHDRTHDAHQPTAPYTHTSRTSCLPDLKHTPVPTQPIRSGLFPPPPVSLTLTLTQHFTETRTGARLPMHTTHTETSTPIIAHPHTRTLPYTVKLRPNAIHPLLYALS